MFGGTPNHEIDRLEPYWTAFPQLRSTLFSCDGTPYSALAAENLKEAIDNVVDSITLADLVEKYSERGAVDYCI